MKKVYLVTQLYQEIVSIDGRKEKIAEGEYVAFAFDSEAKAKQSALENSAEVIELEYKPTF